MGDIQEFLPPKQKENLWLEPPSNREQYSEEEEIESSLLLLLQDYRKEAGLVFREDESLSHLLSSALYKYELTIVTGNSFDSNTFSAAVRNHIPDNFVFKAFPVQFNNRSPVPMFQKILDNPVGKEILDSRGDQIKYAVRCKIVPYPEEIYAVWVIVGCYYLEI